MTLNAKIGGFIDFFSDFELQHKSISFTRWCHWTIAMRSRYRIWYSYINLAWTPQFSAKLLNRNCYRLSHVLWALAQISCTHYWVKTSKTIFHALCRASFKKSKVNIHHTFYKLNGTFPERPGALCGVCLLAKQHISVVYSIFKF